MVKKEETAEDARKSPESNGERLATGSEGFDRVLEGGFPANRLYLVEGDPGTGKTTFALKFLLEGAARGETVLYVTLSETKEELKAAPKSPTTLPKNSFILSSLIVLC